MSKKTITVTPISGIPTTVEVVSIKAVKRLQDVFHHQFDPNEKSKAVIILDANITGGLTDERLKVEETVAEIREMLKNNKQNI